MTLMDPTQLTNPQSISKWRGDGGVKNELLHNNIGSSLSHTALLNSDTTLCECEYQELTKFEI